ncbi:MAG: hypothetical protein ABR592_06190 [Nitriliruptorales bacterium]
MASTTEGIAARATGAEKKVSWVKVGALATGAEIVLHAGVAQLVNPWEGWDLFFETLVALVISGVVLGLLAFGLLLRWGLKESSKGRNRPALASAIGGVISVASYYLFFVWMPVFFGVAAVVLGRTGLIRSQRRGGRGAALVGTMLGGAALAFWVFLVIWVLIFHDYPIEFPG